MLVLHERGAIEPGARALAQLHLGAPGGAAARRSLHPARLSAVARPRHHARAAAACVRVLAPKRRRRDGGNLARLQRMAAAPPSTRASRWRSRRRGPRGSIAPACARALGEGHEGDRSRGRGAADPARGDHGPPRAGRGRSRRRRWIGSAILLEALDRFQPSIRWRQGSRARSCARCARRSATLDPRVFAVAVAELARPARSRWTSSIACGAPGFHPRAPRPRRRVWWRACDRSTPRVGWHAALEPRAGGAPRRTGDRCRAALEILVRRGDVVRVKPDLCFDRAALDTLATGCARTSPRNPRSRRSSGKS